MELEVAPGAISTSAAYEKKLRIDGEDVGHVFDPRTGRPVRGALAVTVWTPRALQGDAASTALYVLGRTEGEEVLPDFGRVTALFGEEDSSSWGGL